MSFLQRGFIPYHGNNAPQDYELETASPLAKGLFSWYPGGNDSSKLRDFGPHQFHGTLTNGPVFSRSNLGQAGFSYVSSGGPDYADVGTLGNYYSQAVDGIWVSVWFSTTSTATEILFGTQGAANVNRFFIRLNVSGTGQIQLLFGDSVPDQLNGDVASDTGITDGELHHIALSAVPAADIIRIFLDGIEQTISYGAQETPTSFVDFPINMFIGAGNNNGSPIQGFDGEIYDMEFGLGVLNTGQALAKFRADTRWDLRRLPQRNYFFVPAAVSAINLVMAPYRPA